MTTNFANAMPWFMDTMPPTIVISGSAQGPNKTRKSVSLQTPVAGFVIPCSSITERFTAVTLASPLFPKHLRLLPQDLCTHYSPCLECSSSDIRLANSLTAFDSLFMCLLLSEAWADQLSLKFQPLDSPHHQFPITLTLLCFFPEYLSPSNIRSHLQLTLEQHRS